MRSPLMAKAINENVVNFGNPATGIRSQILYDRKGSETTNQGLTFGLYALIGGCNENRDKRKVNRHDLW